MTLSPYSLLAIAVILAAIALAWSRRFLASGALVIANLAVFLLTVMSPLTNDAAYAPGQQPRLLQHELGLDTGLEGNPLLVATRFVTSMFVHADPFHLIGNLIILLAFALPFEERIGHRRFLVLYLASGLAGSFVQVGVSYFTGTGLLMGASGAVAGIIGAFAASYPNLVIPLPLPLVLVMFFVRMRVWIAAAVFSALQFLMIWVSDPADNTAYGAHLGGLAFGLLLGALLSAQGGLARHKPVSVDLSRLAAFARDGGSRNALTNMEAYQGEPQVFQAWLERFLRSASCPTCSHKVMPRHEGEMVCTQGHRFDVRASKPNLATASP